MKFIHFVIYVSVVRISDEVFVHITSQLKVHLSLHFLCVLGASFIKCGPCFLECPRVLKVGISDSVNVQLVESTPLVFAASSFLAGMLCPVKFVCGVSSPRHHSLVTRILPLLLVG